MSAFTHHIDNYVRQKNVLEQYIIQSATYVSRMSGDPIDKCIDFIKKNLKEGGLAPLKDPEVLFLQRTKTGDREQRTSTFLEYLDVASKNNLILAPTLTAYYNPKQMESVIGRYITDNLKKRKVLKHKMFEYKMLGDADNENYYNNLQNNVKIKNNSVSGAHASPSTVLFNKSSHSTLTSICRISTSYANANNECFLAGNRHYWCPQVVISSILSMLSTVPMEIPAKAVLLYNLHIPSTEEVMECITYSSNLYWHDPLSLNTIRQLIETLTDIEKACFVYNGDMYHLAKYNEQFVRTFLGELSSRVDTGISNPEKYIKEAGDDIVTMVSLICSKYMDGRKLDTIKKEDPVTYGIVAHNAKKTMEVLQKYEVLISGLWRNDLLPPSIANVPSILRRVVVTSDTDSTIFTNQYWTQWFSKTGLFSEEAYQIGYTTTFLTSQLVKHKLGLMSCNIGAIKEHTHKISMKNEYYFPVFSLTPVAKHYFAFRSAQEGNVFKQFETEIKGVHLRNSAAPVEVTHDLRKYMEYLMNSLITKGGLNIKEILDPVYDIEKGVVEDIRKGGFKYLKSVQVKDPSSYVQGMDSPNYKHYLFWESIFSCKYGSVPPPPYNGVSISADVNNWSKFSKWVDTMSSPEVAMNLKTWAETTGKRGLTTIVLPNSVLEQNGMPVEVFEAMDKRKLIRTISKPFYLVLESLGLYMVNKNNTRLVYDLYENKVA